MSRALHGTPSLFILFVHSAAITPLLTNCILAEEKQCNPVESLTTRNIGFCCIRIVHVHNNYACCTTSV